MYNDIDAAIFYRDTASNITKLLDQCVSSILIYIDYRCLLNIKQETT